MKRKKTKPKIINRIVSAMLSATIMVTGIPFPQFTDGFHIKLKPFYTDSVTLAEDTIPVDTEPAGITKDLFIQSQLITIKDADELKKFSWWYNKYGNPNNTINVNISMAESSSYNSVPYIDLHEGFASIGTEERPFNGTIQITSASLATFYMFKPFFGVVNQSTKILDQFPSGNNTVNVREITFLSSMGYTGDSYTMPTPHSVLANKIVNPSSSTTQMECSVKLECVGAASLQNVKEKDISGIVGTIDDGASLKLNLTNNGIVSGTNYIVDVTGSGPIGLLCGTMEDNSVLTANIQSGTNNSYKVTSSDNSAGGLVGKMEAGSALVINNGENTGFHSVAHNVSGTYCGNLVGYAENAYIGSTIPSSVYPLNMTIDSAVKTAATAELNGTSGNGHLFGYYKVSDVTVGSTTHKNCTITLSGLNNLTVKSTKGNSGGLIGKLEFASTAAASAASSPVFTINGGAGVTGASNTGTQNLTLNFSGSNNGGLIGVYQTSSLKNTLHITDVYTSLSGTAGATIGGLIGKIDDTTSAAYVKIEKAHITGNKGGGMIGTAGSTDTKGAFVDVTGYNKVVGGSTAGIISSMSYGVLRLAGTTDLIGLTSGNMILNSRDSALVYSNGTGNNAEWTLKRPANALNKDDIGSWGEVIRTADLGTIIDETSFTTNHKVSLAAAAASTGDTDLIKFAKVALNIQHNTGTTSEALAVNTANANLSSTLLSGTHAFGTVDLSNTGLTGLTRDGGSSPQEFTGSITNGNITLAVGEDYGVAGGSEGTGRIYEHRWSGLLSAINGATISDLTVTGTCDKKPMTNGEKNYFGGVAALYKGSSATSLTNVTSSVDCTIKSSGNAIGVIGGMIGGVSDTATGTLSFNGCNSSAKITDGTGVNNYFGGYIALVDRQGSGSIPAITINFGNTAKCTIGGGAAVTPNYTNSTAKTRPIYGGLIGAVRGTNAHSIATTINVTNVEANNLIINSSLSGSSPNGAGGLLGYAWYDAEVSIPRLAVTGSSVTANGGSGDLGGLVYAATGHWTVCGTGTDDKVTIASSTFSGSGSLGLLVTRAFNEVLLGKDDETYTADKQAALYLELTNQAKYDPSGAAISGSPSVFDEIAAYSVNPDDSIGITDNGNAVVSINTDGSGTGVTMTGSACNTYQNKTTYGKNTVKTNGNTRYYYNLDTIRAKESKSDAEKLLLWSVNCYAHSSISNKEYFGTSFTPSGTSLDMTGLSYYTIDYVSSFPFNSRNFSLTFYNKEIETGESGTGDSDSNARSTVDSTSQHYMMHCGLFRNAKANDVKVGTITLSGNVGKYDGGSGFIISGKLGGDDTAISKFSDTRITLNNAYIYTGSSIITGDYAPMIINSVGKNSELKINSVYSSGYQTLTSGTDYAATSLIGNVGNSDTTDSGMNLVFSEIVLDARNSTTTISDATQKALFDTTYGSYRSIFANSTLLEHYFGTNSQGVYNYTYEDDWGTGAASAAPHKVTYGQEIDSTIDHKDTEKINGVDTLVSEQLKYYGDDHYTHPTNNGITEYASRYNAFTSNFKPYVYDIAGTDSDNIHELRINIAVVNLTDGCGTYDDPYIIKVPKQLDTVSKLINGSEFSDPNFEINLPQAPSSLSGNRQWCSSTNAQNQLVSAHSKYTYAQISSNLNNVRKYLAGAYYMIDGNMTLSSFSGLGAGNNANGEQSFHGVIVGKNIGTNESPTYPTITLSNLSSFIDASNGCVIKNLNFNKTTFTLSDGTKTQFTYGSGCPAYGGVINKIMGGDNIIDNVGVTFAEPTNPSSGSWLHIVPVGGYVGVILNGGLFFRNMDNVTNKNGIASYKTDANKKYLYRNPIIGRVLNGYAVCEDCNKLDNGDKNYYISRLDSSLTDKLTITDSAITAKNAQSWFVLSLLVNSGTMSDKTLYINSDSKARHLGDYTDVGCLNTKTASTLSAADKLIFTAGAETGTSSANVVPYLMYKYTTSGTNWLSTTNAYAITMNDAEMSAQDKVWELDKGYRGIGGFNAYDSGSALTGINTDCNIKISDITPNNTEIKLNMLFKAYRHEQYGNDNVSNVATAYVKTKDNYTTTENGFGLFNTFIASAELTVSGLTISGSIFSDYYSESDGEIFSDYGNNNTDPLWPRKYGSTISASKRLSCGLFAGRKNDANTLTLSDCTIKIDTSGDGIHSGKNCGGFIGSAKTVILKKCTAQNIKVFGRFDTGGLLGYADGCTISGRASDSDTTKSTVTIYSITQQMRGTNLTEKNNRYTGGGGLVGRTAGNMNFEYIKVTKSTADGASGLITYDNRMPKNGTIYRSDDSTYMGGIVGCGNSGSKITIDNCEVEELSINGNCERTGGIAGGGNNQYTITNVKLDGKGTAVIEGNGKEAIGGIIGYAIGTSSFENVSIVNYTIHKNILDNVTELRSDYYTNSNYYKKGFNTLGVVVGGTEANLNLKNVFVSDCTLSGECFKPVGGVIGYNSGKNVTGYNVVVKDITNNMVKTNNNTDYTINATTNTSYGGDLIGTGSVGNLKIVGFHRDGTPTDKMIAGATFTTASDSSDKYIIFSDYNGTNLPTANTAGSGSAPKLNNSDALGAAYVKSPYATVNPRVDIDSANQLTGDGMANSVAALPIQNIFTDKNMTTGKPNKAYTVSNNISSLADFRLSDFNTEWPTAQLGTDNNFAVLTVETTSHGDSHKQINSYLQLLTNTNYNFGTDVSNVYSVDIYKMQLQGTGNNKVFTKSTNNLHLRKDGENRIYMGSTSNDVDTSENDPTFSLIDVTFFDPTSTSNAAYHLYVPVITKKLLNYSFELATGNGTPYSSQWYTTNNRFAQGTLLAENIGAPGTLYFKYTYHRTKKEWQDALNFNENLLVNYDKVLSVAPINTSDNLKAFPPDTKLILVDANRGGKEYYSTVGQAMSNNKLTLFSANSPTTYTFYPSNTHEPTDVGFTPVTLNDLLYITAEQNNSGKYAKYTDGDSNPATVEAYLNGVKTKFREAESGDTTKYVLTVVNSYENKDNNTLSDSDDIDITERYYLSIFTDKSYYAQGNEIPTSTKPALTTAIHYYNVTSDALENGFVKAKYTQTPDTKQILFANLFDQTEVTYYTENFKPDSGLDPEEINSVMNSVKVKLKAKIQLTSEAKNAVSGQLSAVSMYQSFLVYLTKHDGSDDDRAILGNPTAYADITISSNNGTASPSTLTHSADNKYAAVGLDYVDIGSNVPIGPYITGGTSESPAVATIEATAVITYESTAQQEAQFPAHKGNDDDVNKYADVSAYSNIGFEAGKTALSKNQKDASPETGKTNYRYYIMSQNEPTLDIYAYSSDGQRYGQLGINANDLPDNTGRVHITAAAEFDVRPIAAEVKNAAYVKFTLQLQQKAQRSGFNYSDYQAISDIDAYLYDVKMDLTNVTKSSDGTSTTPSTTYTFIVPRDKVISLDDSEDGKTNYMKLPISFDVYTGSIAPVDSNGDPITKNGTALGSFESRGLMYANYKIKVTAQMLSTSDASSVVGESAPSELVYTNAKLLGDYIK
ncbi:hypothetical protein [uncultured Ruminococcus sp.]|uniref:beta strand repeat-containing protein n=1 Tax=uncultured Ruminococcus sp. TaxID=165186 RepID=UPI00260A1426|nr:hypothetical protein [uncultured Ruminococcus sp.]